MRLGGPQLNQLLHNRQIKTPSRTQSDKDCDKLLFTRHSHSLTNYNKRIRSILYLKEPKFYRKNNDNNYSARLYEIDRKNSENNYSARPIYNSV